MLKEDQAREIYRFRYKKEDLQPIFRALVRTTLLKPIIISSLVAVLVIISCITSRIEQITLGFMIGFLLFGIGNLARTFVTMRKNLLKEKKLLDLDYTYCIYRDCFTVTIKRGEDILHYVKSEPGAITKKIESDDWLFLIVRDRFYVLRRSELDENSVLKKFRVKPR